MRGGFSGIEFGHASHTSTAQLRVLIAVAPAIHSSLDQASLASKTMVQFGQRPSHRIAFRLIDQAIPSILILATARPRIDTVLGFEFWRQALHIDRFDVTSDRVFHLDAIARVLERNPLHAIAVLSNHERCRGGNGTWGSVGIDTSSPR